jgi:hypothetical protein
MIRVKFESLEGTLGTEIREIVAEMDEIIRKNLIKLSGNDEWFTNVDYTCFQSVSGSTATPVNDCLTVTVAYYIDEDSQGNHKFKFTSHEAIFLNEICEVMYKIIVNPEDAEKILFNAKVTIEYLK